MVVLVVCVPSVDRPRLEAGALTFFASLAGRACALPLFGAAPFSFGVFFSIRAENRAHAPASNRTHPFTIGRIVVFTSTFSS